MHRGFIDIDKILKKKGGKLDSYFNLNMTSNDLKFKRSHIATKKEILELEKRVLSKLDSIQEIIINKKTYREKDTEFTEKISKFLLTIIPSLLTETEKLGLSENFYFDNKCTGCGVYEKTCLSKKIKMIEGKPIWKKKNTCFRCYSCLNYCPEKAMQIKSTQTSNNERCSHPYATAEEIAL